MSLSSNLDTTDKLEMGQDDLESVESMLAFLTAGVMYAACISVMHHKISLTASFKHCSQAGIQITLYNAAVTKTAKKSTSLPMLL